MNRFTHRFTAIMRGTWSVVVAICTGLEFLTAFAADTRTINRRLITGAAVCTAGHVTMIMSRNTRINCVTADPRVSLICCDVTCKM